MNKLVLIDGNAIIHRAYHSIPKNFKTRSGEQTNAVYGFATTLIKVLNDLKPNYIAASFDLEGPTFRHKEFKEYKATRVKVDQELYDQIPRIRQLVKTMGIPIYEKQGYEADDVLGTIVSQMSQPETDPPMAENNKIPNSKKSKSQNDGIDTFIVSGDKDIFQLIDGDVKVYNLKKGLSLTQIVDKNVIKKEYNLEPKDFVDLKALAGDPSDNIPGVPGIGPKTATELLQKFDTLEKLYELIDQNSKCRSQNDNSKCKIEDIKPRILKLLLENKKQAFLSQKLATIKKDVPINFELEDCKWGEYDKGKLKSFFEELGFRSLLKRFEGEDGESNSVNVLRNDQRKKNDNQMKLI